MKDSSAVSRIRNDRVLQIFVSALRRNLGHSFRRVILFGSRARGDNAVDSDYDCLVVVDEVTDELDDKLDEIIGDILFENNAVISAILISERQLEAKKPDPFILAIRGEGIAFS